MIATKLGRRVQWQEGESWHVGNVLVVDSAAGWLDVVYGGYDSILVAVIPWGGSLPVYVDRRVLQGRPSREVLNNAK